MTKKHESKPASMTLPQVRDLADHVRNVLADNAKTDTLVYGLLLSLEDDCARGVARKSLKKEMQDAISIAHEQFHTLFFDPDDR